MPLTPDAKAEIAAAIAIVREDRFEKYVRARAAKPADPPADPPANPATDPPANPPALPPGPPPKVDPPADPPPVSNYSKYWGEILSE